MQYNQFYVGLVCFMKTGVGGHEKKIRDSVQVDGHDDLFDNTPGDDGDLACNKQYTAFC